MDVLLSIIVPVYNQEKYVIKALDSIFAQNITFPYEVLVGDDCSTDSSASLLQEYKVTHNYPELKIFYRDHNMSKEPHGNAWDLKHRSKGKYITVLEGDDFWIDPQKLKRQIEFLEEHDEYIAVAHNCVVVGSDSKPNGETYQECKDEEYTFEHFASEILPGQTATIMMRNIYRDRYIDMSLIDLKLRPGDRKLAFALLMNGRIKCIQEKMSAYRHIVKGGSSYSAKVKYSFDNEVKMIHGLIDYANNHKNKKALIAANILYSLSIREGIKKKQIGILAGIKLWIKTNHKLRVTKDLIIRDINRHVLKKYKCVTIL